ncbi:receptor-like protein 20 [Juglans microcarpa x Juglans regia]|uniref:receptor-like protein 20 n=1 Tax=Juglans microcarpa x Juglans regia TaxID=2249226 RepID=UPI001B7EB1F2|nr:receptor-like protein 20 [Juglans microcarpa x Juglans regia]
MIVTENNAGLDYYVSYASTKKAVPVYISQIRVNLTLKGQELELVKVLTIYTSLDLSCNSFDGHIPAEIGEFKDLYALNLSHNAFTGQIPQALGNITALESLDLSSNKLIGEIPLQLAYGLIFLSTLNLSFNQLVGKIPQIKQFTTFTESSFEGNIRLCDFPMKEKCIPEELGPPPPPSKESHWNSIDWDFLSVELGFRIIEGEHTGIKDDKHEGIKVGGISDSYEEQCSMTSGMSPIDFLASQLELDV